MSERRPEWLQGLARRWCTCTHPARPPRERCAQILKTKLHRCEFQSEAGLSDNSELALRARRDLDSSRFQQSLSFATLFADFYIHTRVRTNQTLINFRPDFHGEKTLMDGSFYTHTCRCFHKRIRKIYTHKKAKTSIKASRLNPFAGCYFQSSSFGSIKLNCLIGRMGRSLPQNHNNPVLFCLYRGLLIRH